jgi:hypothetical protein
MDNAEAYDLVTVLSRLQALEGRVTPLMTWAWALPMPDGRAFSEKCSHHCDRSDPRGDEND